ncbi:MAG: hypothetical protein Q8K18_19415 [Burkholderiales bacterium]|nr:hypothetical protein [Burkholderiales bacterium]
MSPRLQLVGTGFEAVVEFQHTLLDRFVKPLGSLADLVQFLGERLERFVLAGAAGLDLPLQPLQHGLSARRREHLVSQRREHEAVQLLHRHVAALAIRDALADAGIALVIAIAAALACCQRHPGTTAAALHYASEQGRRIDHTRRHIGRGACA